MYISMQRGCCITQLGTAEHHASLSRVPTVYTDVACSMYLARRLVTALEATRDLPGVL